MAAAMKRNSFLLLSMAVLFQHAACSSANFFFPVGSQATVQLPPAPYRPGYPYRKVILGAPASCNKRQPRFVAAVSVEARAGGYTCGLVVLLGDVKVWASDHLEKFVPTTLCRLELTRRDGQLRLTDGAGTVGWLSATAQQGVEALHLNPKTGNLVLIDAQNRTRWQSFDHPTDKFLRGEQHRLPLYFLVPTTKLISSPAAFYSFELDEDKIATYVNLGQSKYSYWELAPRAANRSAMMASAKLDGSGLKFLDAQGQTVARITPPVKKPPLSFLELEADGNLGMYYYEARHQKFRASYRALGFCELPLSCAVREVCSAAGKCSDISMYYTDNEPARGGNASICDGDVCMVHLRSVTTVLRTDESPAAAVTNSTLRQCVEQCGTDLSCDAALYIVTDHIDDTADHGSVCSHYTLAVGAREVIDGSSRRFSYWVKSRGGGGGGGGGSRGQDENDDDDDRVFHGPVKTIVIVCGAIDVVCSLVFTVLIVLQLRHYRRQLVADEPPPVGEIEATEVVPNNEAVLQN